MNIPPGLEKYLPQPFDSSSFKEIPDYFGFIHKKKTENSVNINKYNSRLQELINSQSYMDQDLNHQSELIPKLISFIWVGSILEEKRKEYSNILETATSAYQEDYRIILWTDRDYPEDYDGFLEKNNIFVISIFSLEYFSFYSNINNEHIKNILNLSCLLLNIYPKNFGEISDLLRYIIQAAIGGIYSDTDELPYKFIVELKKNSKININEDTVIYANNTSSIFIATKNNRVINENLYVILAAYTPLSGKKFFEQKRLKIEEQNDKSNAFNVRAYSRTWQLFGNTLKIRGSVIFLNIADKDYEPNHYISWHGRKYNSIIDMNLNLITIAQIIIISIIYDIRDIGKLYLNKYNFYIRNQSLHNKEIIMRSVINYLAAKKFTIQGFEALNKVGIYATYDFNDIAMKLNLHEHLISSYLHSVRKYNYEVQHYMENAFKNNDFSTIHQLVGEIIYKEDSISLYNNFFYNLQERAKFTRERRYSFSSYFINTSYAHQDIIGYKENLKLLIHKIITENTDMEQTKHFIASIMNYCVNAQQEVYQEDIKNFLYSQISEIFPVFFEGLKI